MGPAPLPLATPHVGPFCLFPWVQECRTVSQIVCVWKVCQSQWELIKRKTVSGPRFSRAAVWEQERAAFLGGGTRLCLCHFPASCQLFQYLKELGGEKGRGGFSSSLALVAPAGPAEGDDTSWQQVASSFPSVTCLPGLSALSLAGSILSWAGAMLLPGISRCSSSQAGLG